MAKKDSFPPRIYVQWFKDKGVNDGLIASETPQEAVDADLGENEAGSNVAVYRLVERVRMVDQHDIKVTPL